MEKDLLSGKKLSKIFGSATDGMAN
jgi:hypothetical protein